MEKLEKYCNACKTTQPILNFCKDISNIDGLKYKCRKCCKEGILVGVIEIEEGFKKCSFCKKDKILNDFSKNKSKKMA